MSTGGNDCKEQNAKKFTGPQSSWTALFVVIQGKAFPNAPTLTDAGVPAIVVEAFIAGCSFTVNIVVAFGN